MEIINSTKDDIDAIFALYAADVIYQKTKFNKHWQSFDLQLIQKEIDEHRQFKIMVDDTIACIFAISFNDAVIWGDRDKAPSVYIHRIVTNPAFRGNYYVKDIVRWAIEYCHNNGKAFVRMDTWSDNEKLINYYENCGFKFIGLTDALSDKSLPAHYEGIRLSLFEIAVDDRVQSPQN